MATKATFTDQQLEEKLTELSQEVSALVSRRQLMIVFLGTCYAIMSVYLDNIVSGTPPPMIKALPGEPRDIYQVSLGLLSLVVALRFASFHYGMVFSGVQFAKISPYEDNKRARELNKFGVSTQFFSICVVMFLLNVLGFCVYHTGSILISVVVTGICLLLLVAYFYHCHRSAVRFADDVPSELRKVERNSKALRDHAILSLRDVHHDLIAILTYLALICFSALQTIGTIHRSVESRGLPKEEAAADALVLSIMIVLVTMCSTNAYLRLCKAVNNFSKQLNDEDEALRSTAFWRLPDTLLGYFLIVAAATLSVQVLIYSCLVDLYEKDVSANSGWLVAGAVATLGVMFWAWWRVVHRQSTQPAST